MGLMRVFAGFIAVCLRSRWCTGAARSATEPLAVRQDPRGQISGTANHELHPGAGVVGQLRLVGADRRTAMAREGEKEIEPFHSRTDPGHGRAVSADEPRRRARIRRRRVARRRRPGRALAMTGRRLHHSAGAGRGRRFATGWTDDMFMASAVLSRIGGVGRGSRRQAAHDLRREVAAAGRPLHPRRRRTARVGTRQWLRAARRDRGAHPPAARSGAIAIAAYSRSIAGTSRRSRSTSQTMAVGGRSSMSRRAIAS